MERRSQAAVSISSILVIVVAFSVLSSALSPSTSLAATAFKMRVVAGGPPLPNWGALFGARVALDANYTDVQHWSAQLAFESDVGREMDLDKESYAFDQRFPGAYEYWSRNQGRYMYLDWNVIMLNGTVLKWADIASGKYDATIDTLAAGLKAFASPVFLQFSHEPEGLAGLAGTAQNFVSAYQHVHDRLQADGVTNVSYVFTLLAYSYRMGQADQYYPGSSYVDLLGADGYNWYTCPGHTQTWTSLQDVFSSFHDYGVAKGKQMVISEWGSVEDSVIPGRKAQWISDASVILQTWPEVKVVSYFDNGPPAANCSWWVNTTPASLAAYAAMATNPYFATRSFPAPSSTTFYVPVTDSGYGNASGVTVHGKYAEWVFTGPSNHSVTDNSGMGLFDSGTKPSWSTFTFLPIVSANYNYRDTLNGKTGTLRVPVVVSPLAGLKTTVFTITWASAAPPAGYVVDVQIQRPGSSTWASWQSGVSTFSGTFVPDSGTGTYSFRSRIRNNSNQAASWYSLGAAIVVN